MSVAALALTTWVRVAPYNPSATVQLEFWGIVFHLKSFSQTWAAHAHKRPSRAAASPNGSGAQELLLAGVVASLPTPSLGRGAAMETLGWGAMGGHVFFATTKKLTTKTSWASVRAVVAAVLLLRARVVAAVVSRMVLVVLPVVLVEDALLRRCLPDCWPVVQGCRW